jgi:hypothetical protein
MVHMGIFFWEKREKMGHMGILGLEKGRFWGVFGPFLAENPLFFCVHQKVPGRYEKTDENRVKNRGTNRRFLAFFGGESLVFSRTPNPVVFRPKMVKKGRKRRAKRAVFGVFLGEEWPDEKKPENPLWTYELFWGYKSSFFGLFWAKNGPQKKRPKPVVRFEKFWGHGFAVFGPFTAKNGRQKKRPKPVVFRPKRGKKGPKKGCFWVVFGVIFGPFFNYLAEKPLVSGSAPLRRKSICDRAKSAPRVGDFWALFGGETARQKKAGESLVDI